MKAAVLPSPRKLPAKPAATKTLLRLADMTREQRRAVAARMAACSAEDYARQPCDLAPRLMDHAD